MKCRGLLYSIPRSRAGRRSIWKMLCGDSFSGRIKAIQQIMKVYQTHVAGCRQMAVRSRIFSAQQLLLHEDTDFNYGARP